MDTTTSKLPRVSIGSFVKSMVGYLILATILPPSEVGGGGHRTDENPSQTQTISPYIEPPLQRNLTVTVGHTAFLRCPVKFLGDKTVSWIRRRDLHILTSGNQIFTSDPRVSLLRERASWTLRLERVQRKDDSPYECQINTEPKIRLAIFLTVVATQHDEWVVPPLEAQVDYRLRGKSEIGQARILGESNVKIQLGGTLELTCNASHSESSSSVDIVWFQNEDPIKSRSFRSGGFEIQTTKGDKMTSSKLKLDRIEMSDQGNYACGGLGLESVTSVMVSVVRSQQEDLEDFEVSPLSHSGTPSQCYKIRQVILNLGIAKFLHIINQPL